MTEIQLFEKLGVQSHLFDVAIDARTPDAFVKQFRDLCSSSLARDLRSIVYVWSTSGNIPRVKGESNVLYIGKTVTSFYKRHHQHAHTEGSDNNWKKYKYIIEIFGPIAISCATTDQPRESEEKLLQWYSEEHLELPPINMSR